MIFPLVPLIIHFGAKPQQKEDAPRSSRMRMRAYTDNAPLAAKWRHSVSAREEVHDLLWGSTAGVKRLLNISAHLHQLRRCLVKESALQLVLIKRYIAGLKKKRKNNIMMIRKISSFSRAKLEAGINGLGL